jgi:nicotinate-nucleotide adenylyltransferase
MRSRQSLLALPGPEENVKRVGILGGTFDPIHVGHLAVGVAALHQLHLDEVLFVVANVPWQKAQLRRVSSAENRLAMVQLAVSGRTGLVASDIEIVRGGDSYTAVTLNALQEQNPTAELFLIVGSDLVDDLTTWKRWEEIPALCTLAIAYRPGETPKGALAPGWHSVEIRLPALELSSTELREMVAENRPIDFLVPDPVIAHITRNRLYQS